MTKSPTTGAPALPNPSQLRAMAAPAAREKALRLAGASGADPDPDVSPLGPGEDEYLSWIRLLARGWWDRAYGVGGNAK